MKSDNLNRLIDSFSKVEYDNCHKNMFPYIFTKANKFIICGPEKYREDDYFKLPLKSWSSIELDEILTGCKQIISGHGFSQNKPITQISVNGFYKLFNVFHFKPVDRKHKYLSEGSILDSITFEHVIEKQKVVYHLITQKKSNII